MLEVKGLSVAYGRHRALEEASLSVGPGEIVVILGANGAGKSTLLKAVSGICEGRVEGSVALDGQEISGLPAHAVVERGVALVPEGRGVFDEMSVAENLMLGAYGSRARAGERANLARLRALFPRLEERSSQKVRTMSGGERQMVAIGRALMSNPRILMLDEPSLGLSPLLCKELFRNLARLRGLGIGILLVEQNARQSLAIADRGYLLENARIVREDAASALRDDPAVQAAYLGAGAASALRASGEAKGDARDPRPPANADGPRSVAPQVRRLETRPAEAIAGVSLDDLVAVASRRAGERGEAAAGGNGNASESDRARTRADRLAATLEEISRAAKSARGAGASPRAEVWPGSAAERAISGRDRKPAMPADAPEPYAEAGPARIEIYRAPRIEVYRRRPGSGRHEREGG